MLGGQYVDVCDTCLCKICSLECKEICFNCVKRNECQIVQCVKFIEDEEGIIRKMGE